MISAGRAVGGSEGLLAGVGGVVVAQLGANPGESVEHGLLCAGVGEVLEGLIGEWREILEFHNDLSRLSMVANWLDGWLRRRPSPPLFCAKSSKISC